MWLKYFAQNQANALCFVARSMRKGLQLAGSGKKMAIAFKHNLCET